MGKKLTLACMLVIALSIIVPLTGATVYTEDRPAVTAPLSVALEIDAADVALVYTASLGAPTATICYEGKELVDGVMLDKQCMCSGNGTCVCCWWEGWWRVLCSTEGACGPDQQHQDCQREPW